MQRNYRLSNEADADLIAIFDYTQKTYNEDKAIAYLWEFETLFSQLCDYPNLGRCRDEIKPNLQSIPVREHIVFYQVFDEYVLIIRVLHQSRDLPILF